MAPKKKQEKETPQMPLPEKIKLAFRRLLLSFIQYPDDLNLKIEVSGATIFISCQVNRDDHPKLVGSKGTHIWAMQTLVRAIADKYREYNLKIEFRLLEPVVGEKKDLTKFQPNEKWNSKNVVETLREICSLTFADPVEILVSERDTHYSTQIRIIASERERARLQGDLRQALHYLFHAIGKSQGRLIYIYEHNPDEKDASQIMA